MASGSGSSATTPLRMSRFKICVQSRLGAPAATLRVKDRARGGAAMASPRPADFCRMLLAALDGPRGGASATPPRMRSACRCKIRQPHRAVAR